MNLLSAMSSLPLFFLLCHSTFLHFASSLPAFPNTNGNLTAETTAKCIFCKLAVKGVQDLVELNKTFQEVFPLAVKMCTEIVDAAHLGGHYMCPGLVSSYGPPAQFVASRIVLDPLTICQDFHVCPPSSSSSSSSSAGDRVSTDDMRRILSKLTSHASTMNQSQSGTGFNSSAEKPAWWREKGSIQERELRKKYRSKYIHFLHISDIHLDVEYDEGSPTECGLYFCCRSWYNGTGSAGHYGSYQCDLPTATLDLLIDSIQSYDPPPDFIVYTGDNPPHDVWNQTWSSQLQATQRIVDYFSKRLPNIPIYPAIGNHETWPQSEYMGTLKEYQALTHNLSEIWRKWADFPLEARRSISHGGYYSLEVMKGLRIISINTNYGYMVNFYSLLNSENRYCMEQWEWLDKELTRARHRHEKVLLIGHIPPGMIDNWGEYGRLYLNTTKHFKDIIVGHLFGHTHNDQFQLIQDEEGVYGVAMVAPSVTPFGHMNPSYRNILMDPDTMQMVDYWQQLLDLPHANNLYKQKLAGAGFMTSYVASASYHMQDLSPASWSKLAKQFETDPDLLDEYYYNFNGRSIEDHMHCDSACKKRTLCEINNIVSTGLLTCNYKK